MPFSFNLILSASVLCWLCMKIFWSRRHAYKNENCLGWKLLVDGNRERELFFFFLSFDLFVLLISSVCHLIQLIGLSVLRCRNVMVICGRLFVTVIELNENCLSFWFRLTSQANSLSRINELQISCSCSRSRSSDSNNFIFYSPHRPIHAQGQTTFKARLITMPISLLIE